MQIHGYEHFAMSQCILFHKDELLASKEMIEVICEDVMDVQLFLSHVNSWTYKCPKCQMIYVLSENVI